jgi:hypothetical protein
VELSAEGGDIISTVNKYLYQFCADSQFDFLSVEMVEVVDVFFI